MRLCHGTHQAIHTRRKEGWQGGERRHTDHPHGRGATPPREPSGAGVWRTVQQQGGNGARLRAAGPTWKPWAGQPQSMGWSSRGGKGSWASEEPAVGALTRLSPAGQMQLRCAPWRHLAQVRSNTVGTRGSVPGSLECSRGLGVWVRKVGLGSYGHGTKELPYFLKQVLLCA